MSAKDNLKAIHKIEGMQLTNANGCVTIRSEDVGCINISSGRIILGDPMRKGSMSDYKRKCFYHTVAPGIYPIRVYHAQSEKLNYIAFAEILFSEKQPVRYVAAKTIIDTEIKRRGFCGYSVHEGATGFMDSTIFEQICNLPRFKEAEEVIEPDETQDGILDYTIVYDHAQNPCAVRFNVSCGYYYWYWGKDNKGGICSLIGDFFTFA